jgi:ATPase subunit of ABC transporter with duplicated ATPase domains
LLRQKEAQEFQKQKLKEFTSREGGKYDGPSHQAQKKSKAKKLESMEEIEDLEVEVKLTMQFPKPSGVFAKDEKLIAVQDVSFGWPSGPLLFEQADFVVNPNARFAILGKNGCGKSCLLSILSGELQPVNGIVTRHTGVRIALLQQHHYRGEQLDPEFSPFDHIKELRFANNEDGEEVSLSRQDDTAIRAYLANFGLHGAIAMIPVRYLSGGQRMRVALSVALHDKPDVLMLDEVMNVYANILMCLTIVL